MSDAVEQLRVLTVRTASGEVLEVHCDRVKITPRGDLLGIVRRGHEVSEEERARCVLALPNGAWVAVSDADYADAPPMPIPRREKAA